MTVPCLEFEGVIRHAVAFRMQRNFIHSHQKSCTKTSKYLSHVLVCIWLSFHIQSECLVFIVGPFCDCGSDCLWQHVGLICR